MCSKRVSLEQDDIVVQKATAALINCIVVELRSFFTKTYKSFCFLCSVLGVLAMTLLDFFLSSVGIGSCLSGVNSSRWTAIGVVSRCGHHEKRLRVCGRVKSWATQLASTSNPQGRHVTFASYHLIPGIAKECQLLGIIFAVNHPSATVRDTNQFLFGSCLAATGKM